MLATRVSQAARALVARSALYAQAPRAGALRLFSGGSYPPHEVVGLPALSPTMESGTIASWTVSEGEAFSAGDVICEVETDKATVAFESQEDGVLAKILVQPGEPEVAVGQPICVTVEEAEHASAFGDFTAPAPAAAAVPAAEAEAGGGGGCCADPAACGPSTPAPAAAAGSAVERTVSAEYLLSPAARHMAASKQIDASGLQGTGKGGRITKEDLVLALKAGTSFPALGAGAGAATTAAAAAAAAAAAGPFDLSSVRKTDAPFTDAPASSMRKVISKRLTESKAGVPHLYVSASCELDNVLALRKQLLNSHQVKVSVNDLVIRCAALALRDVPAVNRQWSEAEGAAKPAPGVDISVAVATPSGLITPIVTAADKIGLSSITSKVRDLAGRAREGKLAPEEYQGGSFTISNLGMFGIDNFSAVINPPQAAIMAVGGGEAKIVPAPYDDSLPPDQQPAPRKRTVMTVQLSADRRVVDEAVAATYLRAFKNYIEEPQVLLHA